MRHSIPDQAESLRKLIQEKERRTSSAPAGPAMARAPRRTARISVFFAAEKTCGKSSLVTALATGLAAMNRRVLVLDADYGLGNIDQILGLRPRCNFHDVLSGKVSFHEASYVGPRGVRILPVGTKDQASETTVACDRQQLVEDFKNADANYDHILIDANITETTGVIEFAACANEINILVTPNPKAIARSYALMKYIATHTGKKDFNIIPTMVTTKGTADKIHAAIAQVASMYLTTRLESHGYFPYDKDVCNLIKKHQNIAEMETSAPVSKQVRELVTRMANMPLGKPEQSSINLFKRFLEHKKKEKPAICRQQ